MFLPPKELLSESEIQEMWDKISRKDQPLEENNRTEINK